MSDTQKPTPPESASSEPQAAEQDTKHESATELVVVGIGASAGGLEALQEFFTNMPVDSGLAFVVVQHLSPDYKSLMDELLARHTRIPIHIAKDGMQVKPNNIYLIPPRKNISIFHDHLYLDLQNQKKSLNLPVDIFLRSLAVEKQKHAIGIILSGTGSDGTLGARAIKEVGGMMMVQDEKSAKFDGMPRNAIATGLVDFVLEPAKMPEALVDYHKHPFTKPNKKTENILTQNIGALQKVALILREHCGIDFSYYKENTLVRRLERRLSINRFDNLDDYLIFLNESYKEKEVLFKELLIGVTGFFRDRQAFESLREKVLEKTDFSSKKLMRIWSTGCSTGEEVYSVALLFLDYFEKNNIECELKIFATDVDRAALEQASIGFYPDGIISDLDPELLHKYFHRRDNGFQVNENVRKTIVFATHNLLKDPPFSKLDLLVCRNLFIYIKPEMQHRLLISFFHSINPGGHLFLGSSETLGSLSEAFDILDTKWKIYQAKRGYRPPMLQNIPVANYLPQHKPRQQAVQDPKGDLFKVDKVTEQLLELLAPASIIVDPNDNIVHIINNVNRFISFKSGRFSNNLFNSLNPELGIIVTTLLHRLRKQDKSVVSMEGVADIPGFEGKNIYMEGRRLEIHKTLYSVISFWVKDETDQAKGSDNVTAGKRTTADSYQRTGTDGYLVLQNELKQVKENLQATVEELETSNEELQSSNEELIASNEELQSTNEELQSVNEELFTVNYEYQSKIDELTKINNDINNLLKNTEIGALYLDTKLCIRKFTPLVAEITHILPTDIGRPMAHISVLNVYPEMLDDINYVAETLQPRDREIKASDARVFLVRTRPYRTQNNAIEGVLLTFVEITRVKQEQARYRDVAFKLQRALTLGQMACWYWDTEDDAFSCDPLLVEMLGYEPDHFPGTLTLVQQLLHPADADVFLKNKELLTSGKKSEWNQVLRLKHHEGQYVPIRISASFASKGTDGEAQLVDGIAANVSELQEKLPSAKLSKLALRKLLDGMAHPAVITDELHHPATPNTAYTALTESFEVSPAAFTDTRWRYVNTSIGEAQKSFGEWLKQVQHRDVEAELPSLSGITLMFEETKVFEGRVVYQPFVVKGIFKGGLLQFFKSEGE
ncbi:chemotaxis protein CheB [Cyclonatronum proteinivorum]|nr:chemotaxis protein CheB [Cyclonatronum proteinivorum]